MTLSMTSPAVHTIIEPHPGTSTMDHPGQAPRHAPHSIYTSSSPQSKPPRGNNWHEDIIQKRSSIDTRRLTSELDNSLIQQIHALRLELENKNAVVDRLEESLQQSKHENSQMGEDLGLQATEARSLRKQMQLLESGTMSALGDIAKERDDAIRNMTDTRKRLETSKKKVRLQEEEFSKVQQFRDKEQEDWDNEKRKLEFKVHVMENRLKTVLADIATNKLAGPSRPGSGDDSSEEIQGKITSAFGQGSRSTSRAESRMSDRSSGEYRDMRETHIRAPSRLSALHEVGESKTSSLNLADELEGEESGSEGGDVGVWPTPRSPGALPEESELMRTRRYSQDQKARKLMGLAMDHHDYTNGDEQSGHHSMSILMDYMNVSQRNSLLQYIDTATQFSRPASPEPRRPLNSSVNFTQQTADASTRTDQPLPIILSTTKLTSDAPAEKLVDKVSMACQTDSSVPLPSLPASEPPNLALQSDSSTQTTAGSQSESSNASSESASIPVSVPTITIHPPSSRTPSPETMMRFPISRRRVSPTRDAGTQVDPNRLNATTSTASQTERPLQHPTGRRFFPFGQNLGPGLRATGHTHNGQMFPHQEMGEDPPREPFRDPSDDAPVAEDRWRETALPGRLPQACSPDNDNGPVNLGTNAGPSRPVRSGSMFAGFSDDEDTKNHFDHYLSDDETVPTQDIRRRIKRGENGLQPARYSQDGELSRFDATWDDAPQVQAGQSQTSIENVVTLTSTVNKPKTVKVGSDTTGTWTSQKLSKPHKRTGQVPSRLRSVESSDMRKTALVSSGSTAHVRRHRSPSAPNAIGSTSVPVSPPFPVPDRSSSRRVGMSNSEGSPTPRSTSFFSTRRDGPGGRPPVKRGVVRKVQSEAAVTRPPPPSRPPPPVPRMNSVSTSPSTPRSDHRKNARQFFRKPSSPVEQKGLVRSSKPLPTIGEPFIDSRNSTVDIVDAIAQTMIGEFMWKYVRGKSSHGEAPEIEFENEQNAGTGSLARTKHKRFVWINRYERLLYWSNKRPENLMAMGGKGAKKLPILDVADTQNLPTPKNSANLDANNRSLLILTPERALRFTTLSAQRHVLWLTALRALADPTGNIAELFDPLPEPNGAFVSSQRISEEAAEPPQISRGVNHARKRSSTGPRIAPDPVFPGYSALPRAIMSSVELRDSLGAGTFDTSEVMANGPFDAVNTMRMQAFVGGPREAEAGPNGQERGQGRREKRGKKKDMAYFGAPQSAGGDSSVRDDPFGGF